MRFFVDTETQPDKGPPQLGHPSVDMNLTRQDSLSLYRREHDEYSRLQSGGDLFERRLLLGAVRATRLLGELQSELVASRHRRHLEDGSGGPGAERRRAAAAVESERRPVDLAPRHQRRLAHAYGNGTRGSNMFRAAQMFGDPNA